MNVFWRAFLYCVLTLYEGIFQLQFANFDLRPSHAVRRASDGLINKKEERADPRVGFEQQVASHDVFGPSF